MEREKLEILSETELIDLIISTPNIKHKLDEHGIKYRELFAMDHSDVVCLEDGIPYSHFCLTCNIFVCDECDCTKEGIHTVVTITQYVNDNLYLVPTAEEVKKKLSYLHLQKQGNLDALKSLELKAEEYSIYKNQLEEILDNSDDIKTENRTLLSEIKTFLANRMKDTTNSEAINKYIHMASDLLQYNDVNDGYDEEFIEDFRLYKEMFDTYDSKSFSYKCGAILNQIRADEIDVLLSSFEMTELTEMQKAVAVHLKIKGETQKICCEIAEYCAFHSANLLGYCEDVMHGGRANYQTLVEGVSLSPPVILKEIPPARAEVIVTVSKDGVLGYVSKGEKGNYEMVLVNLFNTLNKLIINDVGGITTILFVDDKVGLLTVGKRVRLGDLGVLMLSGDFDTIFTCPKSKLVSWGLSEVGYAQETRKVYYPLNDRSLCEFDVDTKLGTKLVGNCSGVTTLLGIKVQNVKCIYIDHNSSAHALHDDGGDNIVIDSPNSIKSVIVSESVPEDFSSGVALYMGKLFMLHGVPRNQFSGYVRPRGIVSVVRIYKNIFIVSDERRDWRFMRIEVG